MPQSLQPLILLHIMRLVVFLGGTVSLAMRVDNTAVVSISTKPRKARWDHIQENFCVVTKDKFQKVF